MQRALRSFADIREERFLEQTAVRAVWVDLCDRRFKVAALYRVIETLRRVLDAGEIMWLELRAGEIATGMDLVKLIGGDDDPAAAAALVAEIENEPDLMAA